MFLFRAFIGSIVSSGLRGPRPRRRQQLLQGGGVDRLDQVVVEAGLPRAAPVLLLPPAGQRDEHDAARPTAARGCGGRPRSRSASACRCRAGPRRAGTPPPPRPPPGRRARCATSLPMSSQQHRQAVGRVPVVVHDQDAAPGRRGAGRRRRARRPAAAGGGAGGPAGGRRTRCPGRGPRCAPRRVPPCISTSRLTSVRPMPRPPCDRSSDRSTWVNISKTLRQHLGRDADAVVATPTRPPRRPRARR